MVSFWNIFIKSCFLWAIDGKKTTIMDDKEEATKEAKISQELLRDRNKWIV